MKVLNKRSDIQGRVPDSSVLDYGEIAINYTNGDEAIYFKNAADRVVSVRPVKNAKGSNTSAPISQKAFTDEINKLYEQIDTDVVRTKNGVYIKDNNAIYEGTDENLNITGHRNVVLNASSGDMTTVTKFNVGDDQVTLSTQSRKSETELFKISTVGNTTTFSTSENMVLDGKKGAFTKGPLFVGGTPDKDTIDSGCTLCVGGDTHIHGNMEYTSDERLKIILGDASVDVADVAKARAVRYRWKHDNTQIHVGAIAQDWQKILPAAVYENEADETLTLDYNAILVASVISMAKEIEELKEKIRVIENNLENK